MNTFRNFAALALLGFAAFSPAHSAEPATDVGSSDVRKLLEDQPEIAALVRASKDKAIANALKEQLNSAGGEKAIVEALDGYLRKHPLKEGQDVSALGEGRR